MLNLFPWFNQNRPDVRVPRTIIDKILEAITLLLLLTMWGIALIFYNKVPDIIPVHFNFAGEADGWGSKINLFILAGVGTFAMIITGLSSYFPLRMTNLPIKITETNKVQHAILVSRYLRILNILLGILFIVILCSMSESLFSERQGLLAVFSSIIVLLLLLSILIYYLLARRLK